MLIVIQATGPPKKRMNYVDSYHEILNFVSNISYNHFQVLTKTYSKKFSRNAPESIVILQVGPIFPKKLKVKT